MEQRGILKKWGLVSWEPEILISAGLILSLYNVQPLLVIFYNIASPFEIEGLALLMIFLSGVAGVLAVGFSLHLILRAYWLMKMGVAHAFDNRLDVEKFKFKPIYEKRISKIDILKNASQVGRLASLFFAITFSLLLLCLGVILTVLFGLTLSFFFNLPGLLYFVLLAVAFFDFISLGWLKKTRVGAFLYPLFFCFNILTLSFLYKDIYYALVSNLKWYRLLIGAVFILLCFGGLAFTNAYKILRFPDPLRVDTHFPDYDRNFYQDERTPYSLSPATVDSYLQQGDLLKVFIRKSHFIRQAFERDAVKIKIDNEIIDVIRIRDYKGSEYETGYLLFVDLTNTQKGKEHLFSFNIEKEKMPKDYYHGGYQFKIEFPFFKE